MPNEDSDWKQALFGYVSLINEAALNTDARKLREIPDREHRDRLARRLQLTASREAAGTMRSMRSEMRVRIERAIEGKGEIVADVAIHLVRSMEQRKQPWMEERVERERLRFVRGGGKGWRLDTVRLLGVERPSELFPIDEDEIQDPWSGERKPAVPSMPYINPQALYGFKSRVYAGNSARDRDRSFGYDGAGTGVGLNNHSYGYMDGYGQGISRRGIPYFREEAVAYAERWWNEPNPGYEKFEVNCTNYVSQCIFAGGAPMNYTGRRPSGWWYKGYSGNQENWSFSWAVASSLQNYLGNPRTFGLRAQAVSGPEALKLGDVICYDWEGNGRVGHNVVVTAFTPEGMPLVNANTVSSRHRYWDYKDSYAWTENTRYHFYHIADEF